MFCLYNADTGAYLGKRHIPEHSRNPIGHPFDRYLPGGNKNITTNYKDTIYSIKEGLSLLNNKGIILITIYPGHKEGLKESIEINKFLNESKINYNIYRNTDNIEAPYLIEIKANTF